MGNKFSFWMIASAAITAQPCKSYLFQRQQQHLRGGAAEVTLDHVRNLAVGSELPLVFSLDADFDIGTSVGLNHDETHDQLQLDSVSRPCNVIWVTCSVRGTVVKVDTITGNVLGEYRTTPTSHGAGDPSRTTVDQDCSVWLTNRNDVYDDFGSVVHIGLRENSQCHDRNSSSVIDTSTGLGDIRPWENESVATAADECIVHYVKVNSKGARHLSIDRDNNVWVSGVKLRNFDLVKGGRFDEPSSGTIIRSESAACDSSGCNGDYDGYGGYGGLMDSHSVIWSANPLLRWDTAKPLNGPNGDPDPDGQDIGPPTNGTNWSGQGTFDLSTTFTYGVSYGLCIDSSGNVWNTRYHTPDQAFGIFKYDKDGKNVGAFNHGHTYAQGCVVDRKDHIWVAHALKDSTDVGHMSNNGTLLGNVELTVAKPPGNISGSGPTGVAVDGNGKVWTTNYDTSSLSRIDPNGNGGIGEVDMTVDLGSDCFPYNYGDMTGSTNIAPPNYGTWSMVHNISGTAKEATIGWNVSELQGSVLEVFVRNDTSLGWEQMTNGQEISNFIKGSIYVEVRFQRGAGGRSPVLYDLSINNKVQIDSETPPPTPPPPTNTPKIDCTNAFPDPRVLNSPNHQFNDVRIKGVTNPDGNVVEITVTNIYQDEPLCSYGKICPDAEIVNGGARLRAERITAKRRSVNIFQKRGRSSSGAHGNKMGNGGGKSSKHKRSGSGKMMSGKKRSHGADDGASTVIQGDGRVYHIFFLAEDSNGNTCNGRVTVCVPYDDEGPQTCVDGGALYDSTICPWWEE